jgi:hypothetical protein
VETITDSRDFAGENLCLQSSSIRGEYSSNNIVLKEFFILISIAESTRMSININLKLMFPMLKWIINLLVIRFNQISLYKCIHE